VDSNTLKSSNRSLVPKLINTLSTGALAFGRYALTVADFRNGSCSVRLEVQLADFYFSVAFVVCGIIMHSMPCTETQGRGTSQRGRC